MTPHVGRDVHALELGFLADGVVQGLEATRRGQNASPNHNHFATGVSLLRALAAGVGPSPVGENSALQFNAINSFSYAAEALKHAHSSRLNEGLQTRFAQMADLLDQIAGGDQVSSEDLQSLLDFFRGLSEATFERWNAMQAPTILSPTLLRAAR